LKAEADQSLIRAGGVRGKFELAENPVLRDVWNLTLYAGVYQQMVML
jgi:hypothetical protein